MHIYVHKMTKTENIGKLYTLPFMYIHIYLKKNCTIFKYDRVLLDTLCQFYAVPQHLKYTLNIYYIL